MGSAADPELLKETFQFILDKAKDQDVLYFFRDLSTNAKSRRLLAQFIMEEYDVVGA
jgi:aminopeptidase 2